LDGAGGFTLTQSTYSGTSVQRGNSAGTYAVGQDCSLTLTFSSSAGSSSNFTAPRSFKVLMIDPTTGRLAVQTDANTTLTGLFTAQ